MAACDDICGWCTVMERGFGGTPPENSEFGRFDFLYSGAFWGWPLPMNSFRFIAYILTCRALTNLHCIYRHTLWPFHQPLLFDPWLLFWYWGKSWSQCYSVHFLWVPRSISYVVRNMGHLLHLVYFLQAKRLNKYVTYLPLLSMTLLGVSNSST